MSCTRFGGTTSSDFASCATTGRSPTARTTSAGPPASPVRTTSSHAAPKRHGPSTPKSSPSGTSGGATASASSACGSALRSMSVPSRTWAPTVVVGTLAGAASSSPRTSSRRRSGSRSSNSRKTSRSRERSGAVDASAVTSTSTGMSRRIVASSFDTRARSAFSVRFCLRLAPEMSSMCDEDALEVPPLLQQLRGGLVADARDAGDVVARVALQPVEVRDELGRDAVALHDRLVVVQLRLGDPAARRHDLDDAVGVDELERVAVAGDDHRRDRRVGLPRAARRSTR